MKNTNSNKPATGKSRQSTLNRFVDLPSSDESSDPDQQIARAEEQKRRETSDWTGVMSRDQFTAQEPVVTNIWRDQKTPVINFIAYTGGLLGLCMGFSLVSLFEILYYALKSLPWKKWLGLEKSQQLDNDEHWNYFK